MINQQLLINMKIAIQEKTGLVLTAAAVLCLLLTACGGSTSSAAGTVTKSAFVKQATAICKRAGVARNIAMTSVSEKLASNGGVSVAAEQKALVLRAIVPQEKKMVAKLARLQPPSEDRTTIEKMIQGFRGGIRRIEAHPSVAFESVVVTPANVTAEKYGLPECFV